MNETMNLSIIIPTLNEINNLSELLPFLIETAEKAEVIISDSPKSNDHTKQLCEKYNISYYKSPKAGRASQMNYGSSKASGDVLLFLHADVTPPSNCYHAILNSISSGNSAGFFAYKFDPSNRWLDINARYTTRDGWFSGGGDQCQFFTKSAFEELGGYNECFVIMEDFDMIRRLRKSKIGYEVLTDHAIVSSRKYDNNSYLWVNLVNFVVFIAFHLGVSPIRLKKIYSKALS